MFNEFVFGNRNHVFGNVTCVRRIGNLAEVTLSTDFIGEEPWD